MENTTISTEVIVKDAFYVTMEDIKSVKAFELLENSGYSYLSPSKSIYYLTEKGWRKTSNYSQTEFIQHNEVVFTQEEANGLQKLKIDAHIRFLEKEQQTNNERIKQLKEKL